MLPNRDLELWKKYPILKDMIGMNAATSFCFFSNHQFDFRNADERKRVMAINSAFEKLKDKLGSGIDRKIEIIIEIADCLPN